MNFYIASGFQNKSMVQRLTHQIQTSLGWNLTYDWTQNDHAETIADLQFIGTKEYEAVINSDVVIVILPGGKGCHTEMGIALGANKYILLYDPDRILQNRREATTFYYLPQINHWNGDLFGLKDLITSPKKSLLF